MRLGLRLPPCVHRAPLFAFVVSFCFVFPQSDKAAFESLVSSLGWTLTEEGKTVVIKATAANSDAAPVQRTELPPMEALAKLITAA